MIENQTHKQDQEKQTILKDQADSLTANKRRRLLKGAVAIPVIMTLHSGAALARSSNVVGRINIVADAAKDENGNLLCMQPIEQLPEGNWDLGDNPMATTASRYTGDQALTLEEQAEICGSNGGIMISATAFNSISDKVSVTIIS